MQLQISVEMVMDVYQNPRDAGKDDLYLLELFREGEDGYVYFSTDDCIEQLLGVFDTLEAALHAMDIKYEGGEFCGGNHLCVSSIRRNRARVCRKELVSWRYESSCPNGPEQRGSFTLHVGLRTHKVEDYK